MFHLNKMQNNVYFIDCRINYNSLPSPLYIFGVCIANQQCARLFLHMQPTVLILFHRLEELEGTKTA